MDSMQTRKETYFVLCQNYFISLKLKVKIKLLSFFADSGVSSDICRSSKTGFLSKIVTLATPVWQDSPVQIPLGRSFWHSKLKTETAKGELMCALFFSVSLTEKTLIIVPLVQSTTESVFYVMKQGPLLARRGTASYCRSEHKN